jgi:hypothetical protein
MILPQQAVEIGSTGLYLAFVLGPVYRTKYERTGPS